VETKESGHESHVIEFLGDAETLKITVNCMRFNIPVKSFFATAFVANLASINHTYYRFRMDKRLASVRLVDHSFIIQELAHALTPLFCVSGLSLVDQTTHILSLVLFQLLHLCDEKRC